MNFNRGYYTVDMHFFYRITLQALNGSTRYTEIEGLATFDKRVVLFRQRERREDLFLRSRGERH